jgi:hypothetical protein
MSILIGKHIKAVLSADAEVRRSLDDRVYPVAAPKGTPQFPMLVYVNSGINPDYTKDGVAGEAVTVQLVLLHTMYDNAIELMNHIRYLFEERVAYYPDFEVDDCYLTGYSEDYDLDLDKYVTSISLTFNTIDK